MHVIKWSEPQIVSFVLNTKNVCKDRAVISQGVIDAQMEQLGLLYVISKHIHLATDVNTGQDVCDAIYEDMTGNKLHFVEHRQLCPNDLQGMYYDPTLN